MTRYFYLVACFALVLTGCAGVNDGHRPDQDEKVLITSENFDRITQMQWQLEKITNEGVDVKLTGERPFIKFEKDGRFSGFTTINRMFGSMEIDANGKIKLDKVGVTKMAGPEKEMQQEFMFLDVFNRLEVLRMEGIYLHGFTKNKKSALKFSVPVE